MLLPKFIVPFALCFLFVGCNKPATNTKPSLTSVSSDRVAQARINKEAGLIAALKAVGVTWDRPLIYLRAFKQEEVLEVWVRNHGVLGFTKLFEYPFCRSSGSLGPKRKEGDYQIPEGLYYVNRFNPNSDFYLSLGLDYPNQSDQLRGEPGRPGSDIFIHGGCITIGCIPITNDKIQELYLLAQRAKKSGQDRIRVDIFPAKMTKNSIRRLGARYPKHLSFWEELLPFYAAFEANREVPRFLISDTGEYQLR